MLVFAVCAATAAVAVAAGSMLLARGLLHAWERERAEWFRERQLLLNRIKPETAQPLPGDDEKVLPAAGWDDDEDVFAATRGMTKDEFAQRMFDAETN